MVDHFASTPWQVPAFAQLFVLDQEQSVFRLWMIRDGRAQQYAPVPEFGADDYDEPLAGPM